MSLQTFIINRNRLKTVERLADWLCAHGLEVVIIDNASAYPPLLDWYEQRRELKVVRLSRDFGHTAPWEAGVLARMGSGEFVLTDGDLDASHVPADWLERLREGLALRDVPKCGLSIEIDDLPDHFPLKWEIREWEAAFWCH